METPAIPDYTATEKALDEDYTRAKAKYERQKSLPTQGLNHPTTVKAKEKLDLARNALSHFRQARKTLGLVYGTGGDRVDVESEMPMDWGVVKALDADLVHSCYSELNKASQLPISQTENMPLTECKATPKRSPRSSQHRTCHQAEHNPTSKENKSHLQRLVRRCRP